MNFKNTSFCYFQFVLLSFLSIACERPVPKDVMFCKSGEVLILENPFDKESAKIVMYRGDEVKLMGDTVYHLQIDSTKKDSTDFNVKVSAKRGVIGWVHIKDLQKERITNIPKNNKQKLKLPEKKEDKVVLDSATIKIDSTSTSIQNKSDSLTNTQKN